MERANKCYEMMHEDFRKLELRNQIHQKTSKDLDKQQREYFLNQQIRTIQEELGGGPESDVEDFIAKAKTKKWSREVEEHFQKEINRLQRQNPNSRIIMYKEIILISLQICLGKRIQKIFLISQKLKKF